MKKYTVVLGLCFALTGCLSSGAEKPLTTMADALTERNSKQFLEQMDIKRFATSQVQALTQDSKPLNALDNMGKLLGLGGVNDLLGTVLDAEKNMTSYFTRHVSTGELINTCTRSQEPDCPWVPDALRDAKVKELSDVAAVAQVTTPAGVSSWLALAKVQDTWKVVGQAILENQAVSLALADASGVTDSPKSAPQKSTDAPSPPPVTKL